ncbi:hypothetical protein N7475_003111 [Penicillium sp. IBT 31633x]|nr:hypothetical protein N7475_003111 [Penicillium sp. IBT 31633x]
MAIITTTSETNNNKQRVLLVSVPRTASNLLVKILNIHNQPNAITNKMGGYFFYDAFMKAGRDGRLTKPLSQWTADEKLEIKSAFQQALDDLEAYSTQARTANKIMFAKEHAFWFLNPGSFTSRMNSPEPPEQMQEFHMSIPECYGSPTFSPNNKTILPDEYLRTWQLAFIIRHPALAWPSMYRAMQKLSKTGFIDEDGVKGVSIMNMSLEWTRKLFDWCLEQPDESVTPLVIDANDVIHNPGAVTKFCEKFGLDTACMQFEWDDAKSAGNAELEKQKEQNSIFLSTLQESTGVLKDKAPASVDIDTEVAKWRVEFGDEIAQMLEKATRDSMPDYEYLKANRVNV